MPSVTTETRVALKAKLTAKAPVMIWTIPKARNQPQFLRMRVASSVNMPVIRTRSIVVMDVSPVERNKEVMPPGRSRRHWRKR